MNQNRPNQGFGQKQFDQNTPQKSSLEKIMEDFIEKQNKAYNELTENLNKLNTKVELLVTQVRLLENKLHNKCHLPHVNMVDSQENLNKIRRNKSRQSLLGVVEVQRT